MSFILKGNTTDAEIVSRLTPEEILGRFAKSKEHANRWDTERDRLRTFIQDHIEPGRYGQFILEKTLGSPRVYATSEGNTILQTGILINPGLIPYPKGLKAGTAVNVVDQATGEILRRGVVIANADCFSKKPPTNIKLTEIPNED